MSIRSLMPFGIAGLSFLLIATMPAPQGHVNDFANIIPDDREAVLEQRLRAYEAETTIEIAIVTTPSLDGEPIEDWSNRLFRAWGIGKEDTNNGLLIVVAPNDREYRLEVGYGLEGEMTDAQAGSLGREHLPDAFRAGNYAGGIENLTTSVINTLGRLSPEARVHNRAERERLAALERENARRAFWNFMTWTFWIVVFGSGLAFIYVLIRNALRRRAEAKAREERRRGLRNRLEESGRELIRLEEGYSNLEKPPLPSWMDDDYQREHEQIGRSIKDAQDIWDLVPAAILNNMDEAERLIAQHESYVESADNGFRQLATIAHRVVVFRAETEAMVKQAVASVEGLEKDLAKLTSHGYRAAAVAPGLNMKKLKEASAALSEALAARGEGPEDTSDKLHADAQELYEKAESFSDALDQSIDVHSETERAIAAAEGDLEKLPALFDGHRQLLVRIKKVAPTVVYAPFTGIAAFEGKLPAIRELIARAKEQNGMKQQKFNAAASTIREAERLLAGARRFCTTAVDAEREFGDAKRLFPELLRNVERSIDRAAQKVRDGDVGNEAKRKLETARSKLADAAALSGGNRLVDWLTATAILSDAETLADNAHNQAQSDISDAEATRRRKRRQEEESRRRSSDYGGGFGSSSSSSSSSSGGFGGFGGGSSGGGGASGSW